MSYKKNKDSKILFVDDSDIMRETYSELLGDQGYPVFSSSTGAEGLRLIEKHNFSLIISDIQMPKMNGLEFLATVRKKFRDKKCALISAMDLNVQELQVLGAIDFWNKNLDLEKILAKVHQLIYEERRVTNRFSMELPLRINNSISAQTVNLSSDGVLFKTEQSFRNGDDLEISLINGQKSESLNLSGKVVHSMKSSTADILSSLQFFENIGSQLLNYFLHFGIREFKII